MRKAALRRAPALLGAAMALMAQLGLAQRAAAQAGVLARVDGVEITDEDAAIALEDVGPTLPQQMSPDQRQEYIINYLIDLKLTARKAAADKLDEGPAFERKMAYFREKARMQALLDNLRDKAVTEAEIRKVYDEAAKAQGAETEVKASHILVETEEQARIVLRRVRGGEEFAKVAKEVSKDPGSPGGDLGWFTRDRMVPEFAEMAFKTAPGQISDPVKSRFGWHVIKVEQRRVKEFPPLETVRDQVERFITRRAHTEAIQALRRGATIEQIEQQPLLPPLTGKP